HQSAEVNASTDSPPSWFGDRSRVHRLAPLPIVGRGARIGRRKRRRRQLDRPPVSGRIHMRALHCSIRLTAMTVIGFVACTSTADPNATRASGTPLGSSGVPDTGELPDLIVDAKATQNNWI